MSRGSRSSLAAAGEFNMILKQGDYANVHLKNPHNFAIFQCTHTHTSICDIGHVLHTHTHAHTYDNTVSLGQQATVAHLCDPKFLFPPAWRIKHKSATTATTTKTSRTITTTTTTSEVSNVQHKSWKSSSVTPPPPAQQKCKIRTEIRCQVLPSYVAVVVVVFCTYSTLVFAVFADCSIVINSVAQATRKFTEYFCFLFRHENFTFSFPLSFCFRPDSKEIGHKEWLTENGRTRKIWKKKRLITMSLLASRRHAHTVLSPQKMRQLWRRKKKGDCVGQNAAASPTDRLCPATVSLLLLLLL